MMRWISFTFFSHGSSTQFYCLMVRFLYFPIWWCVDSDASNCADLFDGAVICLMVRWEGKVVIWKICRTKPRTGGNRTRSSFLYSRDSIRHMLSEGIQRIYILDTKLYWVVFIQEKNVPYSFKIVWSTSHMYIVHEWMQYESTNIAQNPRSCKKKKQCDSALDLIS
jgi:hypothetical protein